MAKINIKKKSAIDTCHFSKRTCRRPIYQSRCVLLIRRLHCLGPISFHLTAPACPPSQGIKAAIPLLFPLITDDWFDFDCTQWMVTDSDLTRHRESPCLFRTVTGNPPFPFSFFPFPFPLPFPLLYPSRQLSFSTPLLLPFAFQFEFSLFWHIRSLQELTTWLWTAAFVSVCPSDACLNASLLAIPLSPFSSSFPLPLLAFSSSHPRVISSSRLLSLLSQSYLSNSGLAYLLILPLSAFLTHSYPSPLSPFQIQSHQILV